MTKSWVGSRAAVMEVGKCSAWLVIAFALALALACDGQSRTESEQGPKASDARASTALAIGAGATAKSSNKQGCEQRVRELTFGECNPKPSQANHPECTTYTITPSSEVNAHGCVPGQLTLAIAAYPGRMDVVKVSARLTSPGTVELISEGVEESAFGFVAAKGTNLGQLVVREGVVRELKFGPGLKSATGRVTVSCPGPDGSSADCKLK